jgi:hypothetical protein
MKGTELAKAVRRCNKPVAVPVDLNGVIVFVYALKSDLFRVLEAQGDAETGYELAIEADGQYDSFFLRYIE